MKTDTAATKLKETILAFLRDNHMSARRLSLDAGLSADAVRDILRDKSNDPKQSTVEALAKAMDIAPDLLMSSTDGQVERWFVKGAPGTHDARNLLAWNFMYDQFEKAIGERNADLFFDTLLYATRPGTKERADSDRLWQSFRAATDVWVQELAKVDIDQMAPTPPVGPRPRRSRRD